ncbi:hypothetical protein CJJ23_02775 [Mycoplasmopsis agassizii]|uniref:DUF2130 domain-containing protein n=1 Tax=Mycoplasmopsis agassizii TaxID=33922 RepID=A0A269TJV5_9BACT|nr:DUF2130 domain-containing protein [Mycoplasmopsis agassizii]PAK21336.1 hypothetical protein CJJ23_02775 [Mycoplasmopsis agassizii]
MNPKFKLEIIKGEVVLVTNNSHISINEIIAELISNKNDLLNQDQKAWEDLMEKVFEFVNKTNKRELTDKEKEELVKNSPLFKAVEQEKTRLEAEKQKIEDEKADLAERKQNSEIKLNNDINDLKIQINNVQNEKKLIQEKLEREQKSKESEIAAKKKEIEQLLETEKAKIQSASADDKIKMQDDHNKSLEFLKKQLSNLELEKLSVEKELEKEQEFKANELLKKENELKAKLENEKLRLEAELTSKLNKEFENKKDELVKKIKEEEYKQLVARLEEQKRDISESYKEQLSKKDDELREVKQIAQARLTSNIKVRGNELENYLWSQAREFLVDENLTIEKAKEINKTLPDFILEILYRGKPERTFVLEMKTELSENGKQKNRDFYEKLEKDRKNNNADFGILITELEKEQNFMVRFVSGHERLIEMRPDYFLTYFINQKRDMLELARRREEIASDSEFKDLKARETIREFFEELKDHINKNLIGIIQKELETIMKRVDVIEKAAKSIRKSVTVKIKELAFQSTIDLLENTEKFIEATSKLKPKDPLTIEKEKQANKEQIRLIQKETEVYEPEDDSGFEVVDEDDEEQK